MPAEKTRDIPIIKTCEQAAQSRLSAHEKGYIVDNYVKFFTGAHEPEETDQSIGSNIGFQSNSTPRHSINSSIFELGMLNKRRGSRKSSQKRFPIMNVGTYLRFTGVQSILAQFISKCSEIGTKECQILSLGAGFDTAYFILKQDKGLVVKKYFEVDFPTVTQAKTGIINKNRQLFDVLDEVQCVKTENGEICELDSSDYCIISGDLREFDTVIVDKLCKYGYDSSIPTLILSECLLVYLKPQYTQKILNWITDSIHSVVAMLTYDMIHPFDPFGQRMVVNLRDNYGIELNGLEGCPDINSQRKRYLDLGWDSVKVIDLWEYYTRGVPMTELQRTKRLEIVDEFEELELLLKHYCFLFSFKINDTSCDSDKKDFLCSEFDKVKFY